MIRFFHIEGHSLFPLFKEGERIICFKIFKFNKINEGDFVVFYKKPYGLMIKRVKTVKDNQYFVQGTNADSIDSRDFGALSFSELRYKVLTFRKHL